MVTHDDICPSTPPTLPAVILPPATLHPAPRPRPPHAVTGLWPPAPRDPRPEQRPPMIDEDCDEDSDPSTEARRG